ncbi:ficolin-2 [Lingula anatina]|uniref:Ficolin-2 n=1 Tax=Lingula anatina TaxID=7574 RepID=A0A1S3I1V9_LINAN|nr:ficolin-2 [Lingula anatina]|eukprot:XP_013392252.1 ficolin-2 [Lingula anatina]
MALRGCLQRRTLLILAVGLTFHQTCLRTLWIHAQITNQVFTSTANSYLPHSVMKTVTARSPLECVTLCKTTPGCLSCNFYAGKSGNCELNSRFQHSNANIQLQEMENVKFYGIYAPPDCNAFEDNGLFTVDIAGFGEKVVYCDGGWVVVMRRYDNSFDFHRNWASYRDGFGDPNGQFWMGNDALYALTNQGDYSMQIDMKSCNGNYYYVKWRVFRIDNEAANYVITDIIVDSYNTSTNYRLEEVLGWRFGTTDNPVLTCAQNHGGGWWFKDCTRWNLNGYMSCNHNGLGMKFAAITGVNCDLGCMLEAGTMKIRRNT